eukprot:TRINITY_DN4149_c0_g1_i1.p2 TRINITY_DN4149_c0_g1~~TRINITY_DN4149_c0_g1_i1.p2  ORF type:complete len:109 (+),score=63.78 TRINITY_DN4149_c0_g1_i1:29-328(+)
MCIRDRLNSGYEIPMIGFGTYNQMENSKAKEMIKVAIQLGYRHFDTAVMYQNHKEIGQAFKELFQEKIVKREEVFITTCLLYTSPSPRDKRQSRMPSSA